MQKVFPLQSEGGHTVLYCVIFRFINHLPDTCKSLVQSEGMVRCLVQICPTCLFVHFGLCKLSL